VSRRWCHLHLAIYPGTGADTLQVWRTLGALGRAAGGDTAELSVPRLPETWAQPEAVWRAGLDAAYGRRDFEVCGVFVNALSDAERFERRALCRVVGPDPAVHPRTARLPVVITRRLGGFLRAVSTGHAALLDTYRLLPQDSAADVRRLRGALATRGNALGVVTHSEHARQALVQAGVPEARVRTLWNGHDPDEAGPSVDPQEARRRLGLPLDAVVVGYAGNLQPDKGIAHLIEMVRQVPEAHLWCIGGAEPHRAAAQAEGERCLGSRFRLFPWLTGAALGLHLRAADILAIPPVATGLQSGSQVLPLKLFTYLAAARPVLLPELPDTAGLVGQGQEGLRTAPGVLADNVADLRRLVADPALRTRLGAAAGQRGAGLTWDARATALRAFVDERLSDWGAAGRYRPAAAAP
jgi:glycosyltransferase involved in cell wall biosynthesis